MSIGGFLVNLFCALGFMGIGVSGAHDQNMETWQGFLLMSPFWGTFLIIACLYLKEE